MNAFRVLSTDRVSSSGSFAGFVNRNPLKQGTILDNSHWMTISTSEDGTRIEDVKFNR